MSKDIRTQIIDAGRVTAEIREKYFSNLDVKSVRNWLEENGLDRHMALELISTEIALRTPEGIMMQIRPYDNDQLGMWGGVLKIGEAPDDGAIRELFEETGIKITKAQLRFVEVNEHYHQYANGDQAYFKSHRYVVDFDHVPSITTDEESVGAFMVVHTILSHQQEFIKRVLNEK